MAHKLAPGNALKKQHRNKKRWPRPSFLKSTIPTEVESNLIVTPQSGYRY